MTASVLCDTHVFFVARATLAGFASRWQGLSAHLAFETDGTPLTGLFFATPEAKALLTQFEATLHTERLAVILVLSLASWTLKGSHGYSFYLIVLVLQIYNHFLFIMSIVYCPI